MMVDKFFLFARKRRRVVVPMSKTKRASLFVLAIIVTIGVAYVLGVAAAGIVQKYRMKKYRAEKTEEILEQMGSGLTIGGALPDVDLEQLDGTPIKLSQAVAGKALIGFVSPDCGACKIAMERISETVTEPDRDEFVLISDADPMTLAYLRDSLNLHCQLLYDRDGNYKLQLGVFTFPFNLVVSKQLVIEDIIAGAPETNELEAIIESNRQL